MIVTKLGLHCNYGSNDLLKTPCMFDGSKQINILMNFLRNTSDGDEAMIIEDENHGGGGGGCNIGDDDDDDDVDDKC